MKDITTTVINEKSDSSKIFFSRSCRRMINELKKHKYTFEKNNFTINYNNRIYTVQISNYYPFRPPEFITCNGKPISYSPQMYPARLWEDYRKLTDECKCCTNSLCPNNWSPARTIISVIIEYENFIENLKTIQKKRIFKSVKLPDDMIFSILEFL